LYAKKALQMIDGLVMPLEMDSPLKRVLEVFKTTGFAFVPIVVKSDDMMERHSLRVQDHEGDNHLNAHVMIL
jgi:hypothetical protein